MTGSIPLELGRLVSLTHLAVDQNRLTGPIPSKLGQLSNLRQLWLRENELAGPLPLSLANLPLSSFLYDDTELCVPAAAGFRGWLQNIGQHPGTDRDCGN